MKAIVTFLSVLLVSIISGITVGSVLDVSPVIPGAISFIGSYVALPQGSAYTLLFTAPGGVATPFANNFKGLPQYLTWNDVVPLTSLKISTQRDGVLHDWVAASIAVFNGYHMVGAQAANIVLLRVANGFLGEENVTISGVTSAAGAIGFYGYSEGPGTFKYKSKTINCLAGEATKIENFTAIFIPAMAAVTDTALIEYRNGHRQEFLINDLSAHSSFIQEVPQIMVNNSKQNIKSVTFTCVAATPAYVLCIV